MLKRIITDQMKETIINEYLSGKTATVIAKEQNLGKTIVYRILKEAKIKPCLFKRKGERGFTKFSKETELEIVNLYKQGESSTTLAKKYGCNGITIINIIRRHGEEVRSIGGKRKNYDPEIIEEIRKLRKEGWTQRQLAEKFEMKIGEMSRLLRRYCDPAPNYPIEENHHNWTDREIYVGGYRYIKIKRADPYYCMVNAIGYVAEHRYVMAQYLGRPLLDSEEVHHVDGDKTRNVLENLQLRLKGHGKGVRYRCSACKSTNLVPCSLDSSILEAKEVDNKKEQ